MTEPTEAMRAELRRLLEAEASHMSALEASGTAPEALDAWLQSAGALSRASRNALPMLLNALDRTDTLLSEAREEGRREGIEAAAKAAEAHSRSALPGERVFAHEHASNIAFRIRQLTPKENDRG